MTQSSKDSEPTSFTDCLLIPKTSTARIREKISCDELLAKVVDEFNFDSPKDLPHLGLVAIRLNNKEQQTNAVKQLEEKFDIIPNVPMYLPTPILEDDPLISDQDYDLKSSQWPEESGIAEAHKAGIKGQGVLVGVLDSGCDADHQEFSELDIPHRYISLLNPTSDFREVRGFDVNGHGTHVCGIIAGKNIGIAPKAELYVASVIESETNRTNLIRIVKGLEWLMNEFSKPENKDKPKIINMSLGFPVKGINNGEIPGIPPGSIQLKNLHKLIQQLIEENNVLPIVAIGNGGVDYPAAFEQVMGVGAVDFNNNLFSVSPHEIVDGISKPDLVGYGVEIKSSFQRNYLGRSQCKTSSGTSMASAYVTGIAALYLSQNPRLSLEELKSLIRHNAFKVPEHSPFFGDGIACFKLS